MPKTSPISVCVLALTHEQRIYLRPDVLKMFKGNSLTAYNLVEKGRIYGDSPDEWHPFEDDKSVLDYLREVGFEESSLSRLIASFNKIEDLNALVTQVDLYIFDPLFLALSGNYSQLIAELQGAIRKGNKPFCILMPDRLPPKVSQSLYQICEQKLPLLKLAYETEGLGEWKAESTVRLKAFLHRLYRQTGDFPSQEALENAMKWFFSRGIPDFSLEESPKILGR